jgi:hypothetical protein
MTPVHAAVSVPQVGVRALAHATSFVGRAEVFWRLLARGAVLLMFTLGIYRFWLTTDMALFVVEYQLADEASNTHRDCARASGVPDRDRGPGAALRGFFCSASRSAISELAWPRSS